MNRFDYKYLGRIRGKYGEELIPKFGLSPVPLKSELVDYGEKCYKLNGCFK